MNMFALVCRHQSRIRDGICRDDRRESNSRFLRTHGEILADSDAPRDYRLSFGLGMLLF